MSVRVGLYVDVGAVHAVAVVDGSIIWRQSSEVGEEALTGVLTNLLDEPKAAHRGALQVFAVLSPALCRQRLIGGLPRMKADAARAVVEQNHDRFFLRTFARAVVPPPVHRKDGSLIAASLDADVVDAIAAIPKTRVARIGSAAAAMGVLLTDSSALQYRVGNHLVCLARQEGAITNANPSWAMTDDVIPVSEEVQSLEAHYHPALGATRADWSRIPSLTERELRRDTSRSATVSRAVACLTFAISLATWVFAPGCVAMRVAEQTEQTDAAASRHVPGMSAVIAMARQREAFAEHISEYALARRSSVALLASITQSLPESTAVAALRVDSTSISLTLIAPRAMSAFRQLAATQRLYNLHVAGPLTRDRVGMRDLERVTIKGLLVASTERPSKPSAHK